MMTSNEKDYRGPIVKNNLPPNIIFEDCYIRKNNLYYEQIYKTINSQYKIKIRINAYADQSEGLLFVLRPTGWVEYLTVEITLLTSCKWSLYHKGITNNQTALLDFRNDAMEMIKLITNS